MVFGLPIYPSLQVHRDIPFTTLQLVFSPHGELSHGFTIFLHGVIGGLPEYSGKQKQSVLPFIILHPALGPHAFVLHSSPSGTLERNVIFCNLIKSFFYLLHSSKGFPVNPLGQ